VMSTYPSQFPKSKLRLVKPAQRDGVRFWGIKAPAHMPAGRYKVACDSAVKVTKWNKPRAELQFTVVEGEYTGVSLPGWITMEMRAGKIKRGSRYEKYCAMALGEEPTCDEDVQPSVFVGKVFIVEARYRKTDGKSKTAEDDTVKKAPDDELRVGLIFGLAEL
jgi:hypothetical protein